MKNVVLIGLSPQGLFLLRELARSGHSVYVLCKHNDFGIYSKFGKKYPIEYKKDFKPTLKKVINLVGHNARCYITSEYFLRLILEEYPELFSELNVIPNQIHALKILTNKILTYELVNKLDIITPKTFFLKDFINNNSDLLKFPVIIKWNEMPIDNLQHKKTWFLSNKDDFSKLNIDINFYDKLILQEYIGMNFTDSISYGGYFINGYEKLGMVVKQLRQYPDGLSSYVKECLDDFSNQVKKYSHIILKKLSFSGFAEIEFRIDSNSDKLYLIEINPRPWGWIKILKMKYPQFNQVFNEQNTLNNLSPINLNCKWFNLGRDFRSIWNLYVKHKSFSLLLNDLNSYSGKKIFDILEINDLSPFFNQIFKGIRKRSK